MRWVSALVQRKTYVRPSRANLSDIMVEGPAVSSLAHTTELFACELWSMLLKAAMEPDLLVVGEPRSTYWPVAVAENGVYFRLDEHTCIIAVIEFVPWRRNWGTEAEESTSLREISKSISWNFWYQLVKRLRR